MKQHLIQKEDNKMKKISEMGYSEFLSEVNDYINSLEAPLQRGEADPMTAEEWKAAIKREMVDFDEAFTDEQIGWIIERLTDDGFVPGEKFYAVMADREDTDWSLGSYSLEKAIEMVKEKKDVYPDGYIAVIEMGPDPICVDEIEVD